MEDENQHHNNSEKGGEEQSFEELGLDPRLIRALLKKNIDKPTPIQRVAIPLILVINFELPLHSVGYVHRIGHTGRAYSTGASISLVSPDEMGIFEEIKSLLGNNEGKDSGYIAPFPLLSKNAVEALRYRAEDVGKSITKVGVREARAADLRKEILN